MPRRKRLRARGQGLDAVIGHLRTLIKDPESPHWVKLSCIDRLAVIDEIYSVALGGVSEKRRSIPKSEEPEPEIESPAAPDDSAGKKLLETFQKQFFNGGKDGNKSST